jgi:hypothetical protein
MEAIWTNPFGSFYSTLLKVEWGFPSSNISHYSSQKKKNENENFTKALESGSVRCLSVAPSQQRIRPSELVSNVNDREGPLLDATHYQVLVAAK